MSQGGASQTRERSDPIEHVLAWARANSFRYYSVANGCCADELFQTWSCRYDLERFGCVPVEDPSQADLLFVHSAINKKAAPELLRLFESMPSPKYVIAVGSCACTGGAFQKESSYSVVQGIDQILPVDVFVPGCPPRPESIMNGLLILQEKIRGKS